MNNLLKSSTTLEDFTIEKVIGKGSFGSVFLVKRKLDQKLYALKSVFLEKLDKKEQENSVNEVRLLASISHPNVISYKEAFFDERNNTLNIIMEYADNGDLHTEITKKSKELEKFDEEIIWLYSIQMIEGLKALHDKKIMHRDIKSANIFLSKNKLQCKLGDMNVSKIIKEKVLRTQTGTPYYASPEVWRNEPYSYKSDLWSIGCVIYEMCELEPPFNGNDLDELFENVCSGKVKRINKCYSDDLWNMILMLLQKDTEKRVDCDQFLESDLIKKKIIELKNNVDTNYIGYYLEKEINLKEENDFLLETIKFNNFTELKQNLPTLKNYESNINKRSVNNNNYQCNSNSIYKSKNESKKSLKLNSSIKNYNDINYSPVKEREKMILKKRLNKDINYTKENKNPNNENQSNKEEKNRKKYSKKEISLKLNKDNSLKSNKYISYISIPTNEKAEKKIFKDFEKIIELNKIKELLKIHKKKEKLIVKTERGKNYLNKKSCSNLLRNQTENNNNQIKNKIINNNSKAKKHKSKIKFNNNINDRINTEQRNSVMNKIFNLNCGKATKKKLIKSPTSIYIKTNKEPPFSHNIDNKKNPLNVKNILKNLYHKIFNDFNINDKRIKNSNIKHKVPTSTLLLINKKLNKEKSIKRNSTMVVNNKESNLTILSNNKESNSYINPIKKNRKIGLLNEVFNTVDLKPIKRINNINSKYHYYLNTGNYSCNDRRLKIIKKKKIMNKKKELNRKENSAITTKKRKYLNEIFSENSHSFNNIVYNNNKSCNNHFNNRSTIIKDISGNTNIKKIKNLFSFKNYSILVNRGYKPVSIGKEMSKNKNDLIINLNLSKNELRQKILYQQPNNITSSFRKRTLSNSNRHINNNSKIKNGINIKNNLINIKKSKKTKKINIKKFNIPLYHRINKDKSNPLKNKPNFKSHKNILETDINYIKPNKERKYINLKKNKNILNFSENNNYIISNNDTFFQNIEPIYFDDKNKNNLNILYKKRLKNSIKTKRIYTANSGYNSKNEKMVNSQIFNNFYSINNFDSNLPVKVINFYN